MSRKRTTKPKPTTSGVKNGTHKVAAAASGPPEVKPGHPDAHHGQPVKGCTCLCCWLHRIAWNRDEADHLIAEAWDRQYGHLPYDMQVHVGENASAALREAVGALPVW